MVLEKNNMEVGYEQHLYNNMVNLIFLGTSHVLEKPNEGPRMYGYAYN